MFCYLSIFCLVRTMCNQNINGSKRFASFLECIANQIIASCYEGVGWTLTTWDKFCNFDFCNIGLRTEHRSAHQGFIKSRKMTSNHIWTKTVGIGLAGDMTYHCAETICCFWSNKFTTNWTRLDDKIMMMINYNFLILGRK